MTEQYPENKAHETWEKDGCILFLVLHEMGFGAHACGYVRFPERPVQGGDRGYDGFLTYAPVHGGLTFFEQDEDGSVVYGFNCGHAGDESDPLLQDVEWLKAETERMMLAIQEAAEYEPQYLATEDVKERAGLIDAYHDAMREKHGIEFQLLGNFGAMLGVVFGDL